MGQICDKRAPEILVQQYHDQSTPLGKAENKKCFCLCSSSKLKKLQGEESEFHWWAQSRLAKDPDPLSNHTRSGIFAIPSNSISPDHGDQVAVGRIPFCSAKAVSSFRLWQIGKIFPFSHIQVLHQHRVTVYLEQQPSFYTQEILDSEEAPGNMAVWDILSFTPIQFDWNTKEFLAFYELYPEIESPLKSTRLGPLNVWT
jgi:hypothetical protein